MLRQGPETVSGSVNRFDVVCVNPESSPQPANVHIQHAWVRRRQRPPEFRQHNRSGHNFPGVLNQQRQQAVLLASQGKRLPAQFHELLAQIHKQVFITI